MGMLDSGRRNLVSLLDSLLRCAPPREVRERVGPSEEGAGPGQTFEEGGLVGPFGALDPTFQVLEESIEPARGRPLLDDRKELDSTRFEGLVPLTLCLLNRPFLLLFLPETHFLLMLSYRFVNQPPNSWGFASELPGDGGNHFRQIAGFRLGPQSLPGSTGI